MQANWPIVIEVLVLNSYSELALDIRREIQNEKVIVS